MGETPVGLLDDLPPTHGHRPEMEVIVVRFDEESLFARSAEARVTAIGRTQLVDFAAIASQLHVKLGKLSIIAYRFYPNTLHTGLLRNRAYLDGLLQKPGGPSTQYIPKSST